MVFWHLGSRKKNTGGRNNKYRKKAASVSIKSIIFNEFKTLISIKLFLIYYLDIYIILLKQSGDRSKK